MKFSNHYQNAYVTRDIDQAISLLQVRYGIDGLSAADLELDIITPVGVNKMNVRLAFCWIDNLQFELIQPVSGCIKHYLDSLPTDEADFSPRFNHVAIRRDNFESLRKEIEELGLPVLFEGNLNGLYFVYVDARKDLGHILEYVCTTQEIWDLLGWPS